MGKIPHKELSPEDRGRIVGAFKCDTKPAAIARTLGFSPSTVYATVNRYKETGSAQPKPRPGRVEKLTARDQRVVQRIVLAGRRQTLGEITNEVNNRLNTTLHPNTVRRYMAKAGFASRKACKKPLLRKKRQSQKGVV